MYEFYLMLKIISLFVIRILRFHYISIYMHNKFIGIGSSFKLGGL